MWKLLTQFSKYTYTKSQNHWKIWVGENLWMSCGPNSYSKYRSGLVKSHFQTLQRWRVPSLSILKLHPSDVFVPWSNLSLALPPHDLTCTVIVGQSIMAANRIKFNASSATLFNCCMEMLLETGLHMQWGLSSTAIMLRSCRVVILMWILICFPSLKLYRYCKYITCHIFISVDEE